MADNPEWKIQIAADKAAKTLMISDNGTGMDATELEQNLGTIASSGTKKFSEMLKEKGGESLPDYCGRDISSVCYRTFGGAWSHGLTIWYNDNRYTESAKYKTEKGDLKYCRERQG